MSRDILIKQTIDNLSRLPDQKLKEVSDFTEFLISRADGMMITQGIEKLISESDSFQFLVEEEDLYTRKDLKEIYR